MQLCDKLCKKFFNSGFGRSDLDDHIEVQNIQLISDTAVKTDSNIAKIELQVPSVNLIEPTPKQSPSKSSDIDANSKEAVNLLNEEFHDVADIILEIRESPILEIDCQELNQEAMDLENEMILSILDKCTEDNNVEGEDVDKQSIKSVSDDDDLKDFDSIDDNSKRLTTKYGDLGGELILLNLPNPRISNCNFGFKLSGNKDLNTMSVYICQISSNSLVDIDGRLKVGDEILEIDDHIIFGRSHLNATPILKSCNQKSIRFVIHRSQDWLSNMAIPVTYRSLEEFSSTPSSRRNSILDYLNEKDNALGRKVSSTSLGQMSPYIPKISTEEAHTIYLNKGSQGFGFAIMEGSFTNEEGIFIKHLAPSGPAAQDGSLRPGDQLISINNHDISTASYDTALELLKNSKGQVRFVVTRIRCSYSPTHSISSPVKSLYQKRLSAPHITALPIINRPLSPTIFEEKAESHPHGILIKTIPESESGLTTLAKTMTDLNARRRSSLSNLPNADVVTLIMNHLTDDENVDVVTMMRDKHPLGMSIIGGCDTFIGDVIVHDIFRNGVVALDGRIKVGDRILMINDNPVINRTYEEVLIMLQSSCPEVTLKIRHPDTPIQDQDIYEVVTTIELLKKPVKGLGISVIGREGAKGVYICDIVKGGVADVDGRLQPGDQILEINGEDYRNLTQEETATTLKCLMGNVIFKIGRIQRINLHYTPTYLVPKDVNGDNNKSMGRFLTPNGPGHSSSRSPAASPAHAR